MYDYMYMSCGGARKLTREATPKSDTRGVAVVCHSAVFRTKQHPKVTPGVSLPGVVQNMRQAGYLRFTLVTESCTESGYFCERFCENIEP